MEKTIKTFLALAIALAISAMLLASLNLSDATSGGERRLIVATTTSTVDSGLLSYLKPHFEAEYNATLTWLRLGTGQAIEVASRGDADILLVHDRSREDAFVEAGNGSIRITVMYNDFVLIGPPSDPAGAFGENVTESMLKIAYSGGLGRATFVSRGDGSGTHALEKGLWSKAGISSYANASWYLSAGSGMSDVIRIANEIDGYTIADRATYLALKAAMNSTLKLVALCENDTSLLNPYGIVLLNSTRYPHLQNELALDFLLFMVSVEGQSLISNYTVGGKQVFFPIYGNPETIGLPSEDAAVSYINNVLKAKAMGGR